MMGRAASLRWLGLRLALVALAVQVAVPFLLAALLAAYEAPDVAPAFDANLCLHGGPGQPPQQAPPHDCNLSSCPLCAIFAASQVPTLAGTSGPIPVPKAVASTLLIVGDGTSVLPPPPGPYQSRAPPSA